MVFRQPASSMRSRTCMVKMLRSGSCAAQTVPGVLVMITDNIASPCGLVSSSGISMKPMVGWRFVAPRMMAPTAILERTMSANTRPINCSDNQKRRGQAGNGRRRRMARSRNRASSTASRRCASSSVSLSSNHRPTRKSGNRPRRKMAVGSVFSAAVTASTLPPSPFSLPFLMATPPPRSG